MTDALSSEVAALTRALGRLPAAAWRAPTRCAPWDVAGVAGHLATVLSRVPVMVAAPAPPRAEVTAAGYYRADDRFSPAANEERIAAASARAATVSDLDRTWAEVAASCRDQPAGRVVRTRHGDAMLLSDFLVTRVVEVTVHGLDIADALDHPPWLTPPAAEVVLHLIFGPHTNAAVTDAGGDQVALIRIATGRAPIGAREAALLRRHRVHDLALG